VVDADCTPGVACDAAMAVCSAAKKSLGQACGADPDCGSNHCTDGVCCNEECAGTCRACIKTATGVDNGTCANVMAGAPPVRPTECPIQKGTCGNNGLCDGDGTCQQFADGTQCGTYCCNGQGNNPDFCRLLCAGGSCSNKSGMVAGSCADTSPCSRDRCDQTGTTHTCVHDGACGGITPCCCVSGGIIGPQCTDMTGCLVGLGAMCVP
jgi:hypothetical protein